MCELFSCYLLGSSKSGNDIGGQGVLVIIISNSDDEGDDASYIYHALPLLQAV